eukprot:CAMPEP_0113681970 /NCGR_PEP_ID=MMETSP0038_2-20120614/12342_1 /TAXON_ID=2898 /ORGANISM="Cryptomonas paramecium" /LENGTH=177 /DNA_ID=CAMNT_0000600865 /DNA_START=428 /DNA_END=961 /DNA_ORIENTATION=+ /assembly_acc=CAM_ASM_000170
MTRVDWRWAALKGFWDKDNKCWIEVNGGQAGYMLQRAERVRVRERRLVKQAVALLRLVPNSKKQLKSNLMEELPYQNASDPWTEGILGMPSQKSTHWSTGKTIGSTSALVGGANGIPPSTSPWFEAVYSDCSESRNAHQPSQVESPTSSCYSWDAPEGCASPSPNGAAAAHRVPSWW